MQAVHQETSVSLRPDQVAGLSEQARSPLFRLQASAVVVTRTNVVLGNTVLPRRRT